MMIAERYFAGSSAIAARMRIGKTMLNLRLPLSFPLDIAVGSAA